MKKRIDIGLVVSWILIILGLIMLAVFVIGKSFGKI